MEVREIVGVAMGLIALVDDLPEPTEWTSEDWRNFVDRVGRRAHLLGAEGRAKIFGFVLGRWRA
jgi:hypothetical protein